MNAVNRIVPVDVSGIKSTNVKILVALAASLGWKVHRNQGQGIRLVPSEGNGVLVLPDNSDIRESLFSKGLRQIVDHSEKQATAYLCEDLVKTFKPDASTRTRLQRALGKVDKPERVEPKPVAAVRTDGPVNAEPTPIPSVRVDEAQKYGPEVVVAVLDELQAESQFMPYIVKRGMDGTYVSEYLLVDDVTGQTVCSVCQTPIPPQGAGSHFKAKHPTFQPSAETLLRRQQQKEWAAERAQRRAIRAAEAAKAEERLPRQTVTPEPKHAHPPLDTHRTADGQYIFRDAEGQLSAIINIVEPGVNQALIRAQKLLDEQRARIDELEAEVATLRSEREALRELLS